MTRIGIGQFAQESHSFSPVPGSWPQFEAGHVLRGDELLSHFQGTRTAIAGALNVAAARGTQVAPLLACFATSGGPIAQDVFETLQSEMLERLRAALPLDGIYLEMHGGMLAEHDDDATSRVLEAVREVVGPTVPITASLDLHANVTARMVAAADILVGYKTFPHVDMYETATRAVTLLLDLIAHKIRPVTALRRLPMILPGENGRTTEGPFSEVMKAVVEAEQQPNILCASAFSVQPWLDLPDVGCSVLVIADGRPEAASQAADRLADLFWARRAEFEVKLTPLSEAIARAAARSRGPTIMSDPADSPSSGAPGDGTAILRALLDANVQVPTLINIVDADAVEAAIRAGVGETITLCVGAKSTALFGDPVEVTGRVRLISDGDFWHKGPGYHGARFQRGRTVVLQIGSISLQLMERPVIQWDAELYRSVGMEPRDAAIVVVKSPAGFRADYASFAGEIVLLDSPGICSPNLRSFPWKRIGRPCYPLDPVQYWRDWSGPSLPLRSD